MMDTKTNSEKIKQAVRQTYGGIASQYIEIKDGIASCCGPRKTEGSVESKLTGCCEPTQIPNDVNQSLNLYSIEEISDLPGSVTEASLGCGNPTAIAELKAGEVVLDLGSGGGIDCFLAARKVGPEGRVIGLDMTPEMVKLARRNAKKMGAENVDFRYGEMEEIPLPDESVDVILSNCVINLSPDKDAVFGEAYRVLRPGGRMSVSDIVIDGELPPPVRVHMDAWAGCIAGALDEKVYIEKIRSAGFDRVNINSRTYVQLGEGKEWEEVKKLIIDAGISQERLNHLVASIHLTARKAI